MSTNNAMPFTFIYPWRIEARQTAFHPWVTLSNQRHLNTAVSEAARLKAVGKFYSVRARAN